MNAKLMIVAGLVLCMLSIAASATSETQVSTKSYLFSFDTDSSAMRSITNNQITTPDLKLLTDARTTTIINMGLIGSSEISQDTLFTATRDISGRYSGLGSITSHAEGANVQNIESGINFEGLSLVSNPSDDLNALTRVEAKCLGMSMASPGTRSYAFSMEAAQSTKTNAVMVRPAAWMTEDPKLFSVSMEPDALKFENPADSVVQDLNLNFALSENKLESINYDFLRDIDIGDVSFVSKMTYSRRGGWDSS